MCVYPIQVLSKATLVLALWAFAQVAFAQKTGVVIGTVVDKKTQEALIGVTIQAEGTTAGVVTDIEGKYKLTLPIGSYNIKASFVGYKNETKYNIVINSGNVGILNFELLEEETQLEGVEVVANKSINVANNITPLSVQKLSTEEIKSNPGGNFDISRVVQTLPGVGGTSGGGGFRNDIIIRGGAPNENVYYLDGIEIPVLNHFSTQGSAGGPVGMLNVSFIEDVTLSSSSFDARYDNALASVFQFKQRDGNTERFQGNVRLSGTELAATFDTPLGKKTSALFSARRSYLQFLFAALDLPIRPDYWDFQYKVTHKINPKTTITALGVGAIDVFSFGKPRNATPENIYVLRSVPSIEQQSYTVGFALKRLLNNGYLNIALSRNEFNNQLERYEDQENKSANTRILRSVSTEAENKLRIDVNKVAGKWQYSYGGVAQLVQYRNDFFARIRQEIKDNNGQVVQPAIVTNFNSSLDFLRAGLFVQTSRTFFNERLRIAAGLRSDMNTFMSSGMNPLETLSPRIALSYSLSDRWNLNASVGNYYKIPIYTVLGYKDAQGNFANKDNKYIRSTHYVAGLEFIPRPSTRFTLEGFYKDYGNYPVSLRDGISLANQGGGFGAIGNERVQSIGGGRAYGFEFFVQQKLNKGFFGVLSYTFVVSEFSGIDGKNIVSAWDNRHLISGLLGKKFKRNWEVGLRYRFAGGVPYTPFDLLASQRNYLTLGTGVLDYSRLNSERLGAFSQLDIRVDKKWNFTKWTLDLYLDIQNLLVTANPQYPNYTFARTADNSGFQTTDNLPIQTDGSNAIPLLLGNQSGRPLPTLGFIVEF
jgi:outer membrane receptor for ferrienterochelin and colicin